MKPTIRTTIGEYYADNNRYKGSGIYVIACYPCLGCLYVGMSYMVSQRIMQHIADKDDIGSFLLTTFPDSCSFRLDIFKLYDVEYMRKCERKLIEALHPQYNTHHN